MFVSVTKEETLFQLHFWSKLFKN